MKYLVSDAFEDDDDEDNDNDEDENDDVAAKEKKFKKGKKQLYSMKSFNSSQKDLKIQRKRLGIGLWFLDPYIFILATLKLIYLHLARHLLTMEEVLKDDWYQSRNQRFKRTNILKIIFIGRAMIVGDTPQNKAYWLLCRNRCLGMFSTFNLEYKDVKEVLKAMRRRYVAEEIKDKNHTLFKKFLDKARALSEIETIH